jgi:hypothetical protein
MARARHSYALIALLVAFSAFAFVRAEQLKQEPAAVGRPHIPHALSLTCPPGPRCLPGHLARMSFLLRTASPLRLTMVNGAGATVAELRAPAGRVAGGTVVHTVWNGRVRTGARAPDGRYRLRVTLRSSNRSYTLPEVLTLDDTPPALHLIGSAGRLPLHYRLVGAPAVVYVAFKPLEGGRGTLVRGHRGYVSLPAGRLPAGRYRVSMVAVDQAGNVSRVLRAGTVTVTG